MINASPMERSSPPTLLSIQALRAVAAAMVVIFHQVNAERVYGGGTTVLGGWAHLGYAGVDVFFVISGFIMATVTAGRFGSRGGAIDFLAKRAIRIYPLYWLCTAVILAVMFLRPGALDPALAEKSVLGSLLLLPLEGGPLLVVGWTLTYELYFYILTAMALAMASERRVPALVAVWATGLAVAQLVPVQGPWLSLVTSPLGFEFIAGVLAGLYWRRLSTGTAMFLLIASAIWLGIAYGLLIDSPDRGQSADVRALAFGPPGLLTVAALARLELAGKIPVPHLAVAMGNASYALYLTHVFVLSISGRIFSALGLTGSVAGNCAFFVVTLSATFLVALMVHHLVERPLMRLGGLAWSSVRDKSLRPFGLHAYDRGRH